MKIKLGKTRRQEKKEERLARKATRKEKRKNKGEFTNEELYDLINDRFDELEEKLPIKA